MRRASTFLSITAIGGTVLIAAAALAQQTPSPQAVKAAAAATRAAQRITLEARNGSGIGGSVGLQVIGRTRTRITVRLPAGSSYRVTMYPGTDCNDNRTASAAAVAFSPTNFNRTGASMSQTIVALPIEKVRANYVVDVRKSAERNGLAAACARLNR